MTQSTVDTPQLSGAFDTERHRRKVALAATLRLFAANGYEFGFNGHLTVRDPEHPDLYWANPWKLPFGRVKASDLLLVTSAGAIISDHPGAQVSGFASQKILHDARPDAEAVVHVHSPYGFAFSAAPRLLDPINTDSALIHGLQAIHHDFGKDQVESPKPNTTADSLGATAKVLIQKNHGFITIGASVEEAAFYFLAAERAAKAQLVIEAAGQAPQLVASPALEKFVLTPELAEEHFAPLLEQILHDQPDVAQ
ncbi:MULTISPECIES: class II aldolase/adducin family protein [unclassified Pseudarthrobacter]|uniref:class II aldolase/adducin family protein n=1 Tax=unclassified Pseudarthrobacter TaxID=2647000 RepID=UPI00363932CA